MIDCIASVRIIDVAASARYLFGADAEDVAGRPIPEHDYRLEVVTTDGGSFVCPRGASADDVILYLAARIA
jgi:hypothetical protein